MATTFSQGVLAPSFGSRGAGKTSTRERASTTNRSCGSCTVR
jgi:hypothetical protein